MKFIFSITFLIQGILDSTNAIVLFSINDSDSQFSVEQLLQEGKRYALRLNDL